MKNALRRTTRGFTLTELIVTLMIGLLGTIVLAAVFVLIRLAWNAGTAMGAG